MINQLENRPLSHEPSEGDGHPDYPTTPTHRTALGSIATIPRTAKVGDAPDISHTLAPDNDPMKR